MRLFPAVAVTSLALSAPVALADIGWSVESGIKHSDNVTLNDIGEVSDTIASLGGSLSLDRDSRRIQASLIGNGSYRNYLDGTYDDELVGQAAANLLLKLAPDRFHWSFEDTYGQVATNQFAAVTPENRQNINTLSTGPDFLLRLGRQTTLQLSGRYGDTNYQDSSELNTSNWGGSVSVLRNSSSKNSVGVVAEQNRFSYDAPATPNYDQQALYVSWQASGARQSLYVAIGANRVKSVDGSNSNPMLRVDWQRRVTPSWTMNVDLASEYQNTGQQFASQTTGSNSGATNVGISAAPAAARRAGTSFTYQSPRTRVTIGSGYSQLDYVGASTLDEDGWNAMANVHRRLTPRVNGSLGYRINKRDYDAVLNPGRTERIAEAGLDWGFGKSTFLILEYRHTAATSPSPDFRYTDNSISLRVSYRRGETDGGY